MTINKFISKKHIALLLYVALSLFILFCLFKSFKQFYGFSLDGDIIESVVPLPGVQKIFDDPSGIKTIINNDKHLGPNRFFAHYSTYKVFRELPILLQNFCDPVESLYYTAAISKLFMLIMLLFLLSVIISGKRKIFSLKFILIIAVLIPFFQINQGNLAHEMGIIDSSITYSFFYALPLVFVLAYYIPLCFTLLHEQKFKMSPFLVILWIIIAIISCFNGPIYPPTILIINSILFLHLFIKNWGKYKNKFLFKRAVSVFKSIGKQNLLLLLPISFLALYSVFLGTFNNAFSEQQLSLKDLYMILPKGILNTFTSSSYIIIISLLTINYLILYFKYKTDIKYKKAICLYRFLIIFSAIYILLLPLGGYREYRPYILRCDTIIPITVLSLITICYGFIFILKKQMEEKRKYFFKGSYILLFLSVFIFLTIKNKNKVYNECEKASIYTIMQSKEDIVALEQDCIIIGWYPTIIRDPRETTNHSKLFCLWNITQKPKLFYCSSKKQ